MKLNHPCFKSISVLFFATALLTACDKNETEVNTQPAVVTEMTADETIMLLFDVIEPGVDDYQTRLIITSDYIRIDENTDENNFVLVERKKDTVYSVSDDNDAILVVKKLPVDIESPVALEVSIDRSEISGEGVPDVGGRSVVQYEFKVNDKVCHQALIAEGLLPQATKAMAEYRFILAGQHASTMQSVPDDVNNACDLAEHIFYPDRHLQFGLPIQERDPKGNKRTLVDFNNTFVADKKLFVLPADFGRFSIDELKNTAQQPAQSEPAL